MSTNRFNVTVATVRQFTSLAPDSLLESEKQVTVVYDVRTARIVWTLMSAQFTVDAIRYFRDKHQISLFHAKQICEFIAAMDKEALN